MSGRLLSAPFFVSVLLLSQQRAPSIRRPSTILLFLGLIVLSLLNPAQSPLLSNANYDVGAIDNKGIADERGHYYQRYGLLSANRLNRNQPRGLQQGITNPENFIHCGIGMRGFTASPYTHLVDFCGLADALIARLPTIHDPNWRPGHPIRHVPVGYMGSIQTGANLLQDPDLALFYDHLRVVIQDPIFSRARLAEIGNFSLGRYNHLIDVERYRYPDIVELIPEETDNGDSGQGSSAPIDTALFLDADFTVDVGVQGLRLDLGRVHTAAYLDLGLDCDYFEVVLFRDNAVVGTTIVDTPPLELGDRLFTVVALPEEAVQQGYDALRVTPLSGERFSLSYLALLNHQPATGAPSTVHDLAALLHRYYFVFYRDLSDARAGALASLKEHTRATDTVLWEDIPLDVLIDLLEVPDAEIAAIVEPHLPVNILLADTSGKQVIRFAGATGGITIEDRGSLYLVLWLHFLVLDATEQDYSMWFHFVADEEGDEGSADQWMLYDYFPGLPTSQWSPGTVQTVPVQLRLEPRTYDISFGFWTANERQRLYVDQAADIYWINLGSYEVSPPVQP